MSTTSEHTNIERLKVIAGSSFASPVEEEVIQSSIKALENNQPISQEDSDILRAVTDKIQSAAQLLHDKS